MHYFGYSPTLYSRDVIIFENDNHVIQISFQLLGINKNCIHTVLINIEERINMNTIYVFLLNHSLFEFDVEK